jgi:hypothetical protein
MIARRARALAHPSATALRGGAAMSESLRAYLIVDERDVRVFGCHRRSLLEEVLEALADRFTDYDEQGDVHENLRIGHAQALRELFAGKLTRPDCGPIYGWAYQLYCSYLGEWLSWNPFSPCRYGWFAELDRFLAGQGVPLRFAELVDDCPISLPEPRELPCIGHWSFAVSEAARRPLAGAAQEAASPAVAEALKVVAGWLDKAAAERGSVIMGFYG